MATHLNKVNNFSQISCQTATRCTIPSSTINVTVRPSCGKESEFKFLEPTAQFYRFKKLIINAFSAAFSLPDKHSDDDFINRVFKEIEKCFFICINNYLLEYN